MTRNEAVIALSDMLTEIYHFAGLEETESDFLLPSRSRNRARALKIAIDAVIKDRDTEELVYCKDCGRSGTEECQIQNALYGLGDYDFCSYGWRKGANE